MSDSETSNLSDNESDRGVGGSESDQEENRSIKSTAGSDGGNIGERSRSVSRSRSPSRSRSRSPSRWRSRSRSASG